MSWKYIMLLGGVLLLIVIALVMLTSRRVDRHNKDLAQQLLAGAQRVERPAPETVSELPQPVARYLEVALPERFPSTVRIEQRGEMLQGGSWRKFEADQHIAVEPAGFVWDARMNFAPLMGVRVVDMYREGQGGLLQAKLLGVLTVANEGPSAELDKGELARLLAEAPWLPSILAPRDDLQWRSVDATSAEATLRNDGHEVTLLFHFAESGDIVRVEGERPRSMANGIYETGYWVGRFSHHHEVDGVRIPLQGEVGWVEDGEREPYWRGRLEAVQFDAPPPD